MKGKASIRVRVSREGSRKTIDLLKRLMDAGFSEAARSGASMNPFMSPSQFAEDGDIEYSREELFEAIESSNLYQDQKVGPQLLLTKAGIRGTVSNLVRLLHTREDDIPHGHLDGLTADEMLKLSLRMRKYLATFINEWMGMSIAEEMRTAQISQATTVIGRAARSAGADLDYVNAALPNEAPIGRATRSAGPGVVFASAASRNETDPLTDIDARLFAGLLP